MRPAVSVLKHRRTHHAEPDIIDISHSGSDTPVVFQLGSNVPVPPAESVPGSFVESVVGPAAGSHICPRSSSHPHSFALARAIVLRPRIRACPPTPALPLAGPFVYRDIAVHAVPPARLTRPTSTSARYVSCPLPPLYATAPLTALGLVRTRSPAFTPVLANPPPHSCAGRARRPGAGSTITSTHDARTGLPGRSSGLCLARACRLARPGLCAFSYAQRRVSLANGPGRAAPAFTTPLPPSTLPTRALTTDRPRRSSRPV
ncbi:hypothetical protein FS749_011872 [Ceratobasidium sp. UAMH 11750]|nr:hypothetical protein FS749_011872 [Ceratobasidium sp. UAMH 11750]